MVPAQAGEIIWKPSAGKANDVTEEEMMTNSEGVVQNSLFDLIFGWREGEQAAPIPKPADADMSLEAAANIFKALGHEGRLLILCHLSSGEKSVNELENMLDARQSAVSQQLARLRMQGLVTNRREGQTIYYSIKDQRIMELLRAFGTIFYAPPPTQE